VARSGRHVVESESFVPSFTPNIGHEMVNKSAKDVDVHNRVERSAVVPEKSAQSAVKVDKGEDSNRAEEIDVEKPGKPSLSRVKGVREDVPLTVNMSQVTYRSVFSCSFLSEKRKMPPQK